MASSAQVTSFIKTIAPIAQKAHQILGKVKPSVCIAMACVECAYGTAGSCKHHSYLGQKVGTGRTATKYWSGSFFTSKTKEEYTIGTHTVIKAAFRSYKDMEQCVFNYYELLNTSLYKKVLAESDYATQMRQIKQCGYMTSSTEVNSVLSIIAKYNLTFYDGVAESKNPYTIPTTILKTGSSGSSVKWVQYQLNKVLGLTLVVDGKFGPNTKKAVIKYQSESGLVVDGIVGPNTIKALKAE